MKNKEKIASIFNNDKILWEKLVLYSNHISDMHLFTLLVIRLLLLMVKSLLAGLLSTLNYYMFIQLLVLRSNLVECSFHYL